MATSRWPDIVDGLVAGFSGLTGYRRLTSTTTGITVLDSVECHLSNAPATDIVIVAFPGNEASEDGNADDAGTGDQTWGPIGARARDEKGSVTCRVIRQTGDMDPSAARTAAFGTLGDLEDYLRANATLALLNVRSVELERIRVRQYLNEGAVCVIEFDVTYLARI